MKKINWLEFCISCKSWCCHNENPFTSKEELKKLKVKKISTTKEGSCIFLDKTGKCNAYHNRPFECHIFPFDVQEINDKLFWVVWENCPATPSLNYIEVLNSLEKNIANRWDLSYIKQYVKYHKKNQPPKYSKNKFKVIREFE